MDIAITGAGGFIGSNLIGLLIAQGHRVHAFDKRLPTDKYRLNFHDLCTTRTLIDLENEIPEFGNMDRVYHFAADMGGVGFFHKHDYTPYITNSRITFNVLEAIRRADTPRSFVASSACAYPTETQRQEGVAPKFAEHQLEQGEPDQMYGREKMMLLRLAERHPNDVRCGLLHTIYGEGQEYKGQRMKFPTAAATKALQARHSSLVTMWGNGQQLRSYLYIADAIRKINQVVETDNYEGVVNIGYEGATTCLDIQKICLKAAGVKNYVIDYNPGEPSGVLGRDCDNSKYRRLYGDTSDVKYDEGFGNLVAWLDNQR